MRADITPINQTCTRCNQTIKAGKMMLTQRDGLRIIKEHTVCPQNSYHA